MTSLATDCGVCLGCWEGELLALTGEVPQLRCTGLHRGSPTKELSEPSTVRIWRSLAPRLQPVTAVVAGAALANHAAGAFRFPSSVENFAQQAQKHLPIPDSLITDEPLMAGTFERRVDCAGVVAFVLTSVMLGKHQALVCRVLGPC